MPDLDRDDRIDSEVIEKDKSQIKEPTMYKVVLHNDNYTTKDFVVHVISVIFHKPVIEATRIMLNVHKKGRGVVGVFSWDIANTKVSRVHQLAKENEFPLKCSIEEA